MSTATPNTILRVRSTPLSVSSHLSDADAALVWQNAKRISCTPLPSRCLTLEAMVLLEGGGLQRKLHS
jgi:hypothetical protein